MADLLLQALSLQRQNGLVRRVAAAGKVQLGVGHEVCDPVEVSCV